MSYPNHDRIISDLTVSYGDLVLDSVEEPQTAPSGVGGDAGVLSGTYTYMCTFVTADGETEGRVQSSDVVVVSKKINLSSIPVSSDSRVIARRIYRKPASASADVVPLQLLVEIADNTTTTYIDNIADASLGVLVNRINTTGGQIIHNGNIVFSADTTNLSIGWDSGYVGTAYASTAVGIHTLSANEGKRNTAVGMYALHANTTGNDNTAIGVHALNDNVDGNDNTAVGYGSLFTNITGDSNTALGFYALNLCTANSNTAVGYRALVNNTTGPSNVAVGKDAAQYLTGGTFGNNVFIGHTACNTIVAGSNATAIQNSVIIGQNTKPKNSNDVNSIIIGYLAEGAGANTVVIGNTSIISNTLHGGLILDKTVTAAGTTGAQTINKPTGTVNFAAAAASLVVTNSLVTANSIIHVTVGTNDATMKSALAVAAAGSFTIFPNSAPTAETRVNFTVTN